MSAQKATILTIGTALGALMVFLGWKFAPNPWVFVGLILIPLLIEAWKLLNREPGDTISEGHWWLSQRPLIPFVYGMFTTWVMFMSGWHLLLVCAWVGLMMHFFFQSQEVYWRLWKQAHDG